MKKLVFAVLLIFVFSVVYAEERGLTTRELKPVIEGIGGIVPAIAPQFSPNPGTKNMESLNREEWAVVDSIYLDTFIPAGNFYSGYYDNSTGTLSFEADLGTLIPEAEQAVAKAPAWLRVTLKNTLSQLDAVNQQKWADVINEAVDPYIDEIAFSIANISVEYLSSPYAYTELFTENAYLIYEYDADLSYVEVVDYGLSYVDDDYYSTTSYWKEDANGVLSQVEVPREIYYWYIVHPKITDEIPAYIDPEIVENNTTHNNNITSPEDGVFWRDYLYNHNDDGYPKLKYYLQNCDIVWNGTNLSIDTAVGAIKIWINQSMSFTSNSERPHQPVRIYAKHIGRCGEYSDFTSAATRIALIPSTGILCISGDHTWNEFWDEEWISWEPVNGYINNPLVYENGWGKVFGSVFEIRSDGVISPVTDRYSEGVADLNVYVVDADSEPVDGARILLGTSINGAPVGDNVGFTDNEGKYVFIVGDARDYYASVSSSIGNTAYELLVDDAQPGQTYTNTITLTGEMPILDFTAIATPNDPEDDWKIQAEFNFENQVIHGLIPFDDIDNSYFNHEKEDGLGNFFMCSETEFGNFSAGSIFSAFQEQIDVAAGNNEFNIPTGQNWYAVFDNGNNLNNPQHLSGWVTLSNYDEMAGSGVLSGTVTDPANAIPVVGATVTAGVFQATTDSDGNYSLDAVHPNTYDVIFEADGYFSYIENGVEVTVGGNVLLDVEMQELAFAPNAVNAVELENGNAFITWNQPEFFENITKKDNASARELTGYNILIGESGDENNVDEWAQIATGITTLEYEDSVWPMLPEGIYKYAVKAVYTDGILSLAGFSNKMYKDKFVTASVSVFTNSGDSPDGALVNLKNQDSPNSIYDYNEYVNDGTADFAAVFKGIYTMTVSLANFESYILPDIEIMDDVALQGLLYELIAEVRGLSVINYQVSWDAVPADSGNRSFQNYHVFVDDMTTPAATINENYYDVSSFGSGFHQVGVSAVFTTGESAISELEYEDGSSLSSNITAHYALDGDAVDSSGNGFDGQINGDVTFAFDGVIGLCAEFDEDAEYILAPDVYTTEVERFSVSWWLNPVTHSEWNQQVRSAVGWNAFNFHTTNDGKIYAGTDTGTRFTPDTCSEGIVLDEWQLLTFTFENGFADLYRNGFKIAHKENMTMSVAWGGFQIGAADANTIDGKVDDVRVWERSVGPAEIQYLFTEDYPFWGTIEGTVTSAINGNPVEGAVISAGMFEAVTDANGDYSMSAAACTYARIECAFEDYDVEFVEDIVLGDGETMVIDFEYGFTGSEEPAVIPQVTKLYGNYPNPFNPSTTISFSLTTENTEDTELAIYNLKGQKVKVFSNHQITKSPNQQIVWDGKDDNNHPVSSGIYFYRLKAGTFTDVKKMILMK